MFVTFHNRSDALILGKIQKNIYFKDTSNINRISLPEVDGAGGMVLGLDRFPQT